MLLELERPHQDFQVIKVGSENEIENVSQDLRSIGAAENGSANVKEDQDLQQIDPVEEMKGDLELLVTKVEIARETKAGTETDHEDNSKLSAAQF